MARASGPLQARTIRVVCTWETWHDVAIPAGTPHIQPDDLEAVHDATAVDLVCRNPELTDWEVIDHGQ